MVAALFEGIVALDSGIAAASPEVGGALLMLSAPLGMVESSNITAGVLMFGLGLYDATVPRREEHSRPRIFWENFAAWHLIVLASLPEYYYRRDYLNERPLSFGPGLVGGNPGFVVSYRF